MLLFALLFFSKESFIEFDEEGKASLKSWRQKKLDKELEELEHAEQYALIVVKADIILASVAMIKPKFI